VAADSSGDRFNDPGGQPNYPLGMEFRTMYCEELTFIVIDTFYRCSDTVRAPFCILPVNDCRLWPPFLVTRFGRASPSLRSIWIRM